MGGIFSILRPDFTWHGPCQFNISETTPPTPRVPGKLTRRFYGFLHASLQKISGWYCACFGIQNYDMLYQLPFGLILKRTEHKNGLEQVAAMKMARAAGMPVPLVLTLGEHPDSFAPFSILMTRLPGDEVLTVLVNEPKLDINDEQPWISQLHTCLSAMRKWESPYGGKVCSVLGTRIHSWRVPMNKMGPFETQDEMHDYLLSASSPRGFDSMDHFDAVVKKAEGIRKIPHRMTFTHGDLRPRRFLIGKDNQLTGFLGWGSGGGWCPEYWDFTSTMRHGMGSWWYQVLSSLSDDQYHEELARDRALHKLTVDSYVWW